ncbi:MAG: hypothetical protein J6A16_04000 [Oscillospiraceae bacterium]|nr:hypothetical protein [Oscillospiraceae bacterium]
MKETVNTYDCRNEYCPGDRVELCPSCAGDDDINDGFEGTVVCVDKDFVVVLFDRPLNEHEESTIYDCYELYTVREIHVIVKI